MSKIDVEILFNPRTYQKDADFEAFLKKTKTLNGHKLFQSSGTSGLPKWVALSQEALESSAESINKHHQVTKNDVFALALPLFHVGGYGVFERARVSGARLVSYHDEHTKWSPHDFEAWIRKEKATMTSLVVAQLYDLIKAELKSPPSLRLLVLGGGSVPHELYLKARELGWTCLITYGLTEMASQVASSTLESLKTVEFPNAELLSHVEIVKTEAEDCWIKSSSLMSAYILKNETGWITYDPKVNESFLLPDRVFIASRDNGRNLIEVRGRREESYKVLGEWIRWAHIKTLFYDLIVKENSFNQLEIAVLPDSRRGNCVVFFCEDFGEKEKKILNEFNQKVYPFERITHLWQGLIPRSELGKPLIKKIQDISLKEISG